MTSEHPSAPAPAAAPDVPDLTGNPLARPSTLPYGLPDFAAIRTEHFRPALRAGIAEERAVIEATAGSDAAPTFDSVLAPLEVGSPLLDRAAHAFFTILAADGDDDLYAIEAEISPELTALDDALHLNPAMLARIDALAAAVEAGETELTAEQAHLLARTRRRFELAGARLSEADRERLAALNQEISAAETSFSQAVTRDLKAASLHVTDESELEGLDTAQRATARIAAQDAGLEGWLLTLVLPSIQPLESSLARRDVRERLHRASLERGDGTWGLAARIASLRADKAALLGFASYAALAVADRTAAVPEAVEDLFARTAAPAMRNTDREAARIAHRAAADGIDELAPWDLTRYADLVQEEDFAVDQEALREHFELDRVLEDGVLRAAGDVYGLSFARREDLVGYHPDVRVYEVLDADGTGLGLFLGDFFTRPGKRGGAWMNPLVVQSRRLGTRPVVLNNLNISKPAPGEPALVTLDEVRTMFHEFGHALHGLLSDVENPSVSGTAVPRDVVEFPSQVNEMWILREGMLEEYARHARTGEPLPEGTRERLEASALWGEGRRTVEYLAAAVLDWRWHSLPAGTVIEDPRAFEAEALADAGLAHPLVPPRYRTGYFNHTFSGGYAAGYYSYLWAEVFDADSVAWFEDQLAAGRPLREVGDAFRHGLLGIGGSRDLLEAYRAFRGADRDVDHLLRRRGLLEDDGQG
ncbi:M3 family metallopeptidase [Brachybacterium huguangmaarense]